MPSEDTRFRPGCRGGPGRPKGTVPLSQIRREMQGLWDELDGVGMVRTLAKKDPKWFVESVFSLLPRVKEEDTTVQMTVELRLVVDQTIVETTRVLREMRASGVMLGFQPIEEQPQTVKEHLARQQRCNGNGDGNGVSHNGS